ncbi:MAG: hypothetical protein MJ176_02500 [Treponema sp.]|nr:hypothetical protein [Treponema sp.]
MRAIIPNPNDELLLKKYISDLLMENNKKEINLFPSMPLYYFFQDSPDLTQDFIKDISKTTIESPQIIENKIISTVEIFTQTGNSFKADLILATIKNPSSKIHIPEKGFIRNLKVFRLADIQLAKENNVVSWTVSESHWKKL